MSEMGTGLEADMTSVGAVDNNCSSPVREA